MLIIGLLVVLVLSVIAWQDYTYRAVHWWLFVLLFSGLGSLAYQHYGFRTTAERVLVNSAFIGIQLLFLTLYFSLKEGRRVNVFEGYFGLGDLCFLISITIYFPLLNYVLFYVVSLLLVIIITLMFKLFKDKVNSKIPLAGYQAVCFIGLMIFDYFIKGINLSSDFFGMDY